MGCGLSTFAPSREGAEKQDESPATAMYSQGSSKTSTTDSAGHYWDSAARSNSPEPGRHPFKPPGTKPGSRLAQQQSSRSKAQREPASKPKDLEDLEIIVRDPLRLGLSKDFAQSAAELKPPREFSFEELAAVTGGFADDRMIGQGGFGFVYHGRILRDDGSGEHQEVAIKKLDQEGLQGFNEWLTEVIFLRRLRHPHLVGFVGYCTEEEQGVLVYEYMANGSLDKHLFDEKATPLTWEQRINVALGAAKGLAYLHEGTGRQVIFRDLKAANILLDRDFNAKLSDFGLAKDGPDGTKTHVSTQVVGTYGYTAPEYMQTGHLTAKSDVYAFGVVLLELLSGRRAVDEKRSWDERNLAFWAKPLLSDRKKLPLLIDPKLGSSYPTKAAQKLAAAANCCLLDVKSRPSMVTLVNILTNIRDMGEAPPKRARQDDEIQTSEEEAGSGQPSRQASEQEPTEQQPQEPKLQEQQAQEPQTAEQRPPELQPSDRQPGEQAEGQHVQRQDQTEGQGALLQQ